MNFTLSIRNFFIAIISILLLVFAIVYSVIYLRAVDQRVQLALESQLETASAVSVLVEEFIRGQSTTLELAGASIDQSPQLQTRQYLLSIKSANPQLHSIAVREINGDLLTSSEEDTPRVPPKVLIRNALRTKELQVSGLAQIDDILGIYLVVPIIKNGSVVNIVNAVITDRTFFELLRIRIGVGGNVGLIDHNGRAITLTFDPDLPFAKRDRRFIPSVRGALDGKRATTRRFYDPVGDIYRMGASEPIPGTGWVANIFRPVDEVVRPLQIQTFRLILVAVLAALLISAIILYLVRVLTQPISIMVEGTRSIYRGDYSHRLPTRFVIRELCQLSRAFNTMLERIIGKLQTEKFIADTLQKSLITPELPKVPGFEISVFYASATEEAMIGGDFFDVFRVEDGKWAILIGDISGKGVSASLSTALTKFAIRDNAIKDSSPASVLQATNFSLYHQFRGEEFVSVFYLLADSNTGHIQFGNAGHPYPTICSEKRGRCQQLKASGVLLGVIEEGVFEENSTRLEAGEQIVLFTDGVIEARNDKGEFFAEKGLLRTCTPGRKSTDERIGLIYDAIIKFTGGTLSDDVAIMVIERTR